jgi:vacuolar iron transporter family protein
MMAGAYLDAKTDNDHDAANLDDLRRHLESASIDEDAAARTRLLDAGYDDAETETFLRLVGRHPESRLRITAAVELGITDTTRQSPAAQAAWMFAADIVAASVPVVPFALFRLGTARVVSVVITTLLHLVLGVGRAVIGRRRVIPTVLETMGIAAGAAVAGLLIGNLVT